MINNMLFIFKGKAVVLMVLLAIMTINAFAQDFTQGFPREVVSSTEPPYYAIRYEGSENPGELEFGVTYTIWIPEGVNMAVVMAQGTRD